MQLRKQGEQYVITTDRKAYQLPCGDLCSTTCLDQDPDELSITVSALAEQSCAEDGYPIASFVGSDTDY